MKNKFNLVEWFILRWRIFVPAFVLSLCSAIQDVQTGEEVFDAVGISVIMFIIISVFLYVVFAIGDIFIWFLFIRDKKSDDGK